MSQIKTHQNTFPLKGIHVCLVEDDKITGKVYSRWLEAAGGKVTWSASLSDFKKCMEGRDDGWIGHPELAPDLVLSDLILPDGQGTEVLAFWRKTFPHSPVLIITAFATVENAVETMKLGAFDFIRKPAEPEELVLSLRRAYEHGRLVKENETLGEAVRIFGMAQTLSAITEKSTLLKTFTRLLHRELHADECFAFVSNGNRAQSECLFESRSPGLTRTLPETVIENHLQGLLAAQKGRSENCRDAGFGSAVQPESAVYEISPGKILCVELKSQTGNSAFIVALSSSGNIALRKDNNALGPIILQAARGFQTSDVADRMVALSFVDDLTGLYNQRFLEVAVNNEMARADRYGTPFSLLFFDLDKFKQINDVHGHLVGSQILRESAHIFQKSMRDSDQLLRFGGDEFVAILPNTQSDGAARVAERIRGEFEKTYFDVRESTHVPSAHMLNVTTSIGCACYPDSASTSKELVHKADEAMYEAKRAGKNRLCIAPLRKCTNE